MEMTKAHKFAAVLLGLALAGPTAAARATSADLTLALESPVKFVQSFWEKDEPVPVEQAEELFGFRSKRAAAAPKFAVKSTRPAIPRPRSTRPELASERTDAGRRYKYYSALSRRLGLNPQRMTVLGFRGLSPDRVRHPSTDNATRYDDTFVILDPEKQKAWEFLGSTHAGQFTSSLSPSGVAQIQPGIYRASPSGDFAGMPCWWVTTLDGSGEIPSCRDANGNGVIGATESANPTFATEILFHNGRYNDYGSSIGCQVLPPDLMEEFIATVGVENEFDFLLLDANRPENESTVSH